MTLKITSIKILSEVVHQVRSYRGLLLFDNSEKQKVWVGLKMKKKTLDCILFDTVFFLRVGQGDLNVGSYLTTGIGFKCD